MKNNNIIITIIYKNNNHKDIKEESKNIICPDCKELAFTNINEDIINMNCINNHHKEEYFIS